VDERCEVLCLDLPRAEELRARQLDRKATRQIASRLRALGDPTRLGLVGALANGEELCVCDLAWISGKAQNLVSHHLRLLKQEGLAQSRRDGKIVFYSLTEAGSRLYALAISSVDRELEAADRAGT
jgi:ArsR family transcriptional regulator, lead/cadmium/zinc/bismuth-responsive transcriptional repressor